MPSKKKPAKTRKPEPTKAPEAPALEVVDPEVASDAHAPTAEVSPESQEPETPQDTETTAPGAQEPSPVPAGPLVPGGRDPRLPEVGATITRQYKGAVIEVMVTETGFEYGGTSYSSLSKLASTICNQKAVNGFAFFKLNPSSPGRGTGARLQSKILKVEKAVMRMRAALEEGQQALTDAEKELASLQEKAEQLSPKSE